MATHRRLRAMLLAGVLLPGLSFASAAEPPDTAVTASLRLRVSRQGPVWWESAQKQLRQGQTTAAFALLAQLQREAPEQFLIRDDTAATADALIEQLVGQLSAADRRAWEVAVADRAQAAWEAWQRERNPHDLDLLCRSFGQTEPGLRGWQTFAARHRDSGRREHALIALAVVAHHPRASDEERASAVLSQAALWRELGRDDRINTLWEQYQLPFARTWVRRANQSELFAAAFARFRGGTNGNASTRPPESQPTAVPVWSHRLAQHDELQALWDEWQPEFRAAGVWALPANEPLAAEGCVVTRTTTGLVACEADTGAVRWQTPPSQEFAWLQTNPGMLENRSYRSLLVEQLYRRALANSVLGRLSTDGRCVFAIHDSRGLGYGSTSQRPPEWPGPNNEPRWNSLSAYRLDTGELAWRVGGESAGPTYPLAGAYFCGPPTPIDDLLFVVIQQASDLRLLALRAADGQLAWSTVLGETPKSLLEDPRRQRAACPVTLHRGVLLCPTAAGAVVAVDPITHALRWAWRYPVESRVRAMDTRDNRTVATSDAWWDGWRDIVVCGVGDLAAFVSPETSHLHALDVRTGKLQWSQPRDGGLILAGSTADSLLVAEPTAIRAHRSDTGALRWRTPIGELTGRPVVLKETLVVPAHPDGLVALRLSDGQPTLVGWDESASPTNAISNSGGTRGLVPPYLEQENISIGNLVHTSDGWFATSVSGVTKLSSTLAEPRRVVPEIRTTRPPGSEERSAKQFELKLSAALAAAHAGALDEAARQLLALAEQASRDEFVLRFNPRRLVRADLAVVAAWDDLTRAASPIERELLHRRLGESWQSACDSNDPFAPQRWRERWQPLPFAQHPSVIGEPRVFLGQPLVAVELGLLSAVDRVQPAALRWRLSEELARAGLHRDADEYRRTLLREQPGALLPGGTSISAAVRAAGEPPPLRDPWPLVQPDCESQKLSQGQSNDSVHHYTVPLDAESTPLFERLDVTLDRQGRLLRFSGAGERGAWELALPQLAPARYEMLRHDQELVQGWGRGRLLVLRVGADLFAVAPFDDRNEPQARVRWTLSLLDASVLLSEQIVPTLPGPRDEPHRLLDPFGRAVGQVGPVRAGFLCYQESGRLVCIETLTGRKRWERFDLPFDAVTFGDDELVLIWSPRDDKLEWLRAIDGVTLGQRTWQTATDDLVLQRDRRAWRIARGKPSRLMCENVVTAETTWRCELAPGSVVAPLDGRTLGIVDSRGVLQILNAEDGAPRGEALTVDVPPVIERVVASRDAERWYVTISERTAQQAAMKVNQPRQGFRVPIVTGPLYAIDRNTSLVQWHAMLDREAWPIDQPRSLPILLQAYQALGAAGPVFSNQPLLDGILHLRDKRTGRDVLHRNDLGRLTYVSAWGDPDRAVVNLALQNESIRLYYRPSMPPPPSLPMPADSGR